MKDPNIRLQTPSKYSFSTVDGRGVNIILMYSLLLNGEPCQVRLDLNYMLSICSEEYQSKLHHKKHSSSSIPRSQPGKGRLLPGLTPDDIHLTPLLRDGTRRRHGSITGHERDVRLFRTTAQIHPARRIRTPGQRDSQHHAI